MTFEQLGRDLDTKLANLTENIDDARLGVSRLAMQLDSLDARVSTLESTSPEPPPPTSDNPYPSAKTTVHVHPGNADQLLRQVARAEPGTHFVLGGGTYDIHGHNLGGNVIGTPSDPIVIRAAKGHNVAFHPSRWDIGEFGGILQFYGQHVVLDGLTFGTDNLATAGRLLNIYSRGDRLVSKNVIVHRCNFFGSWRHATVCQGENIGYSQCVFERNCRFNEDGSRGVWPYNAGSWWYYDQNQGNKLLSSDIWFDSCRVEHVYGEGLCCNYCYGGIIKDCKVLDARFAGLYFMNCSNIQCVGNNVYSVNPVAGRGSDFRGLVSAIEQYSSYPINPLGSVPGVWKDNLVDGGDHKGIRHAMHWMVHQGDHPEQRYDDWKLSGNSFSNTAREEVWLDKVAPSAAKPTNCVSDMPLNGFVGNPDGWVWPGRAARGIESRIHATDTEQFQRHEA